MTRSKTKPRKRNARTSVHNAAAIHKICSVTDPFCNHAEGSHSPFGTAQITIPLTIRGVDTVANNANGNAVLCMSPGSDSTCIGKYVSTSTISATALNTSMGSFPSVVSDVRLVSAGIRWWYIGAMTDSGGTISVATLSDLKDVLDGTTHTYTSLTTLPGVQHVSIREPGSFVFKMSDAAQAEQFTVISSAGSPSVLAADGWNAVVLTIQGKGNTTQIAYSWTLHYEATLDLTTGFTGKSSIPRNPLLAYAQQANWESFIPGPESRVRQYFESKAKEYLFKLGRQAATKLIPGGGVMLSIADRVLEVD